MKHCRKGGDRNRIAPALALLGMTGLAACQIGSDGARLAPIEDGSPLAPGVATAQPAMVDQVTVGNRLMAAGEHDLALEAFYRAAAEQGLTAQILTSIGSANLQLGRLDQSEAQLRKAIDTDERYPIAWNNLGAVLMEKGEYGEASRVFQTAFALDNGASDEIRSNLRLSLAKKEDARYSSPHNTEDDFGLVWQGNGSYKLVAP